MTSPRNLSSWLPGLLGPLALQTDGTPVTATPRPTVNLIGAGALTVADDPDYTDPEGKPVGRTNITFAFVDGGLRWRTALDLDFRAEDSQSLTEDGGYTIAGKVWQKRNTSGDRVAMAIVHGAGLVIQPVADTDWGASNGTGFTLPVLDTDLFALSSDIAFGRPIRVTCYVSASNAAANYDRFCVGVFGATNASKSTFAYVAQRGFEGGQGVFIPRIISEGSNNDATGSLQRDGATNAAIELGASNDLLRLFIPEMGMSREQLLCAPHGVGDAEIPADNAFSYAGEKVSTGLLFAGVSQLGITNTRIGIGAARGGAGSSDLSITLARLVVEVLA